MVAVFVDRGGELSCFLGQVCGGSRLQPQEFIIFSETSFCVNRPLGPKP